MPKLSIDEIRTAIAGEISPGAGSPGRTLATGYSIDTRQLEPGDLFFALKGEHRDGHDFVRDASLKGAVGAVVSEATPGIGQDFLQIIVRSPLTALQQLASHVRSSTDVPVIAISGSNGKTTTKEMIALLLATKMRVHRSPGNFNNNIGLPLSILGLNDTHQVLVTEMGSNHRGEISKLCDIAHPEVGVITNVGTAHIGLFGSVKEIALEKTDLARRLKPDGRAVVNSDNPALMSAMEGVEVPTIGFGTSENADFRASDIEQVGDSGCSFTVNGVRITLQTSGLHNIYNATAAIAASSIFGVTVSDAGEVLPAFVPLRMRATSCAGIVLIDDSYNANPDSVKAALDVLSHWKAQRKLFVMGEMLELGDQSDAFHREVGTRVAASGVDFLIGIGGLTREAVVQARREGMDYSAAVFFENKAEAKQHIRHLLKQHDAILVKGSRMTGLDEICDFLKEVKVKGRI